MADKLLTDEAVIKLLQEEAQKASRNSAIQGLRAYLPRKSATQALKPNTRFLRNLVQETHSHNKALLAKEAEEARARLKALSRKEAHERGGERKPSLRSRSDDGEEKEGHRVKRWREDFADWDNNRLSPPRESKRYHEYDMHKDHMRSRDRSQTRSTARNGRKSYDYTDSEDNDANYERSTKRARRKRREVYTSEEDEYERTRWRSSTDRSRRHCKSSSNNHSDSEDYSDRKSSRRTHKERAGRSKDDDLEKSRDRRKSRRSPSHSRSISSEEDLRDRKTRKRKRRRSPSTASEPGASPQRKSQQPVKTRIKQNSKRIDNANGGHPQSLSPKLSSKNDIGDDDLRQNSDSDPLEQIVGPLPPPPPPKVRIRGRGAANALLNATATDMRFSASYDPSTDVTVDASDEDDWGQALEALEARAKFKKTQAERLKAAGFTDEEVKLWERGGNKDERDVKWAKLGEGREWDRGKVLDVDGRVGVGEEFGRLKGT
ncbi:uncharacterized protein PV09_07503 [Verruconis gallopava]|uniref:Pre-mRNA-splicing factor 38B n=1 Tax=Verruconis gallopava TaxID=253628 RepID=A0A0D1XFL6_9PEZI|nr:uncharacterized protein PV09_07503 [Verruconis gallopava]KIW00981.1 hypothetical protein PV09_07503 [Verruconis gallopava]